MTVFMTTGHFQFYHTFDFSNSNFDEFLSATPRSSKELILASKPDLFFKILTTHLALGFCFEPIKMLKIQTVKNLMKFDFLKNLTIVTSC